MLVSRFNSVRNAEGEVGIVIKCFIPVVLASKVYVLGLNPAQ